MSEIAVVSRLHCTPKTPLAHFKVCGTSFTIVRRNQRAEIVCRWLMAIVRPNQTEEPDGPLGRFNSSGNESETREYEPDHEVCAKGRTFADGGDHYCYLDDGVHYCYSLGRQ